MKRLILFLMSISIFTSCTELDIYDEPSETLSGVVIDSSTGEPILTEQPNGFRIKMMELSWSDTPLPYYFWGKSDGSFNNSKIFKGTYDISVIEGAFFQPESQSVEIINTKTVEFQVIPYLTVHAKKIELSNDKIEVEYTLSREKVGDKILDSRVFVSTNPNVGNNILTPALSPIQNLKEINDNGILNTIFKESISGLEKGKTYYVRVGARTNNTSLRYNFSKTVKIDY
jgi:hypothetical protein